WFGDLRTLMASFHKDRLVHGGLREPNIVCEGEKVIVLGFDWGGGGLGRHIICPDCLTPS
ncbi:hypothetical protein F5148DRAFT_1207046, partial [Russula earlei]